MNFAIVSGVIYRAPEMSSTRGGDPVCNCFLREGRNCFRVSFYGEIAQESAKLTVGSYAVIELRLRMSTWSQNDATRYDLMLIGHQIAISREQPSQ
jgi:single-stranded DNA-binding protein